MMELPRRYSTPSEGGRFVKEDKLTITRVEPPLAFGGAAGPGKAISESSRAPKQETYNLSN